MPVDRVSNFNQRHAVARGVVFDDVHEGPHQHDAASTGSVGEGMLLLTLYSIGLGIPFVAIAAQFERSATMRGWLARHSRTIQRVGAAVMLLVGTAYLTGLWSTVFSGLQAWFARHGWPPF